MNWLGLLGADAGGFHDFRVFGDLGLDEGAELFRRAAGGFEPLRFLLVLHADAAESRGCPVYYIHCHAETT